MYFIRNGVPLRDIMIITPYSSQEHIIKKFIDEKKPDLKDVHVSTVVTSQGNLGFIMFFEKRFLVLFIIAVISSFTKIIKAFFSTLKDHWCPSAMYTVTVL